MKVDAEKPAELRTLNGFGSCTPWRVDDEMLQTVVDGLGIQVGSFMSENDTKLVLATRNALPFLLDDLEQLRKENERLSKIRTLALELADCLENDRLVADVRRTMNFDTEQALDALIAAAKEK